MPRVRCAGGVASAPVRRAIGMLVCVAHVSTVCTCTSTAISSNSNVRIFDMGERSQWCLQIIPLSRIGCSGWFKIRKHGHVEEGVGGHYYPVTNSKMLERFAYESYV